MQGRSFPLPVSNDLTEPSTTAVRGSRRCAEIAVREKMIMQTCPEVISRGRLVTVDGEGRLHPAQGDPLDVITDQLDTVVVQWGRDDSSWVGWLTTSARRTVRFTVADLEDPVLQNWLRALPGWDHARLWRATTRPGVHLVWRRRVVMEMPRP
jgi:hypothetical protein